MFRRRIQLAAFAAACLVAAGAMAGPALGQSTKGPKKELDPSAVLTWSPAQQRERYKDMEDYFKVATIKKGDHVSPLPAGTAIDPKVTFQGKTYTVDRFMEKFRISGLMAVKDGKVVLEKYGLGRTPADRWTSFSVAKSVTSILYGAALRDGWIPALTDPVVKYIPELKGSAYDGVNLEEVLTMTSGVKWNEDYTDPKSDVARSGDQKWDGKEFDPLVTYMAKLPREAPPGTKFVYKTGETDLAGLILTRALAGKTLSQYASEKLWAPYGMEQDGIWMLDKAGHERGGCCMSMTLHDYARIGLFMLGDGKIGDTDTFWPGWVQQSTSDEEPKGQKVSYGYLWWATDPPNYQAIGIYGQGIAVYPGDQLVIALNSAMPKASDKTQSAAKQALFDAIRKAAAGQS